jgi:hypothetical protein
MFPRRTPKRFAEMDFLRYALGFEGVSLMLSAGGTWLTVKSQCRHLQLDSKRCAVFGSSARPKRCEYFDEYKCSMKPAFQSQREAWIKVSSQEALTKVEGLIRYDSNGRIVGWPSFEALRRSVVVEPMLV